MTIRFYPSRLPGEPLETHEHGVTTIRNWLVANVEVYEDRDVPPLAIELGGQPVPPGEWAFRIIRPESDVRMYPVPFGLEVATIAWIGVGIAVATAAYSLFMMGNIDAGGYTSSTGRSLDLNPAKANSAKLGDAIREVFGRVRIYPDYVVQPVTRFDADDPTKMRVQMLLCLGVGALDYTNGDIRVGSTPASTLPDTRSPTARAVPPACLIVRAVHPFSDSVGVLVVLLALGVKTNARPVTRTCEEVVLAVVPV